MAKIEYEGSRAAAGNAMVPGPTIALLAGVLIYIKQDHGLMDDTSWESL